MLLAKAWFPVHYSGPLGYFSGKNEESFTTFSQSQQPVT